MPPSDEERMARCRDGDVAAFETLMRRHLDAVTKHVRRIVFDPDQARDLAQDVFLKLYVNRGSYTGEGRFVTWLMRIATNAAIDHLRRQRKRRCVSLYTMLQAGADDEEEAELHETLANPDAPAPQEILAAQEQWTQLVAALEHLPPAQREVFRLRAIQGLNYKAIAERLDCSPEAARNRMHAAKHEIRRRLGGQF